LSDILCACPSLSQCRIDPALVAKINLLSALTSHAIWLFDSIKNPHRVFLDRTSGEHRILNIAQCRTACRCAMTKPTWACTSCGEGFGRKFSAKRHVDTVHQGLASYVRWSEYVAGRTTGIYLPGEPPKRGSPKHTPTWSERMMDAMHEGFYNETGRILARQALTPTSFKLPAFASTTPYVQTPYFGSNIFSVEAYVCSNCLAVKPGTLCYVEGDRGGGRQYRFFCPQSAAKDPQDYGETREEFMARTKKYCIDVLQPTVTAWIGTQLELIAVEIVDPNRYTGRITFLKTDAGKTYSVTLNYIEDRCIILDASKTGAWAIRAIIDGQTHLNSQEVSEFLAMTETTSYGFFRLTTKINSRTFLMVLARSGENTALRLKEEDIRFPENNIIDKANQNPRNDAAKLSSGTTNWEE
jgi:hypothetical protein